jgi:radical SAM superfamily enzyme YgiQ (UPF0313 family)
MAYIPIVAHVVLVNANWGALFSGRVRRYNRSFPPLDLLNCASLLRADGHEVELYDCRARPSARADVLRSSADILLVSLSSLDRWQCPNTDLEQLEKFLEGFPMDRTLIYGAQVTVRPLELLSRTGAMGALLGEPESSIVALANGARPGTTPDTARLDSKGNLVASDRSNSVSLETLPMPAFDLLDYSDYHYEVLGESFGLLEMTRGCPWRCKFCLLDMYGKKYRRKSVVQMVTEIQFAMKLGMRCAYFQDLEFTLDQPLIRELCEALIQHKVGLRWACQTRPDTVDKSLLTLMREAGCELIHFGVESGVEEVAEATGKRQSLVAVERAVDEAREVGMRTLCYFLIGMPGESVEQMGQTLAFAQKINPTYASFQVATPYPTTPWHQEHFSEMDEPFPSVFPGKLDEDALRTLARSLTAKYHLRPRYLLSRLMTPGRRAAIRETSLLAKYLFAR